MESPMRTIPAREIKRCGISVVDTILEEGPVHVIKNDKPSYVIMNEAQYDELVEGWREATITRVKLSEAEFKAGRSRTVSVDDLMGDLGEDE
jgi:PHD/YefM family antitoxin component YafN of YafNO toxin-antitoxin module